MVRMVRMVKIVGMVGMGGMVGLARFSNRTSSRLASFQFEGKEPIFD